MEADDQKKMIKFKELCFKVKHHMTFFKVLLNGSPYFFLCVYKHKCC